MHAVRENKKVNAQRFELPGVRSGGRQTIFPTRGERRFGLGLLYKFKWYTPYEYQRLDAHLRRGVGPPASGPCGSDQPRQVISKCSGWSLPNARHRRVVGGGWRACQKAVLGAASGLGFCGPTRSGSSNQIYRRTWSCLIQAGSGSP